MIEIVKKIARRILRDEIETSNNAIQISSKLIHEQVENIINLTEQNQTQDHWIKNQMQSYSNLSEKYQELKKQTFKPNNVITSGMLLAISVWLKNPNKVYSSAPDTGIKDIEFEDSFGCHLLTGKVCWFAGYARAELKITGYEGLNIVIPIVKRIINNGAGVELTSMCWDVNGAFQVVDEETFWKIIEVSKIDMNRILKECTDGDC